MVEGQDKLRQLKGFLGDHRKDIALLGSICILFVLIEALSFNRGFLFTRLLGLKEQRYSIYAATLYQFKLEKQELVAQGNDPHIAFENIKVPVAEVSIACSHSASNATGQIFYSNLGQAFSEERSVQYDASLPDETVYLSQIFGIPRVERVSSLRLDLTDVPGDVLSCGDFVVNPHVPPDINPARFAIYMALFLLAVSLVSQNGKPLSYLRSRKAAFGSVFFGLLLILGIKLMPFAVPNHILLIVALSVLLFAAATTYSLYYLAAGNEPPEGEKESLFQRYKHEILLATVIMLTTLPLLTQSYFYYDDWWNIGTGALLNKQSVVTFGRPIQILFQAVFDNINIRDAYVFKWVFLPPLILYAIVLYRWLLSKTKDDMLSFFLAGLLSVFAPAMDLLGYTATSAVCYSILFSALCVICFEKAWECCERNEKPYAILNSTLALLLLFTALLTYQIGAQIVFVFLAIEVYFNVKRINILLKELVFLLFFGLTNGLYLLFLRFLNQIYLVQSQTNRSEIIHTAAQVLGKVHFYESVLVQSLMQLATAFTGGAFIRERYHGYIITFADQTTGQLVIYFVSAMIVIALAGYLIRTRNVVGFASLLAFAPMSYFVFLVLSENGYLTYYAFAHISLLVFYFVIGLIATIQFLSKKISIWSKKIAATGSIKPATIVVPLLILCALVSNYYIRDFYINFNSTVYDFVKYSLQTGIESGNPITRIHVNGTISPINSDVYSRFVVETALKDLGENAADYAVTFSRNRYFLSRIQEADYTKIREVISAEDQKALDNDYAFDPTYGQYYLKAVPGQADKVNLQRIFMLAGAIPQIASPHTLIIDLSWTDRAYFYHTR